MGGGEEGKGGVEVAGWEGKAVRAAGIGGSAVAALGVITGGAQPSLPTRQQVDAFLRKQSLR